MTGRRAIRIVYVIDKLHRAGAQVHLLQLLRGLDRQQFEASVCCLLRGGGVGEDIRGLGLNVDVLDLGLLYSHAALRQLFRLGRSWRARGVELIHTYLIAANVFGTLAARLGGVPAVVTSRRDTGFSRNWRMRLFEEWLVNPRVDAVTAVSAGAARIAAAERGLDPERVVTIPNGVDLALYDPEGHPRAAARERFGLAEDERVVGVVGHLSPVKGHADLFEAMALLARQRPKVRLLVVGDGVLRRPLEAQARALSLDGRVTFTGVRDDVVEALAALDVFVLPSHTEGMSNALLEAMAMARPVVATAVGGNPDVVQDGIDGLLVPAREPLALAAAIERLLDGPEEARRLGCAARRRAQAEFGIERMVRRYQELYRGLVHG